MATRSWLRYIFGPRLLRALGVEYPERPVLELVAGDGVELALEDVPATDATKVTISALASPGGDEGAIQARGPAGTFVGTPYVYGEGVGVTFADGTLYTTERPISVTTASDSPVSVNIRSIPTNTSGTIIVDVTMCSNEESATKRFGAWSGAAKFYRRSSGDIEWLVTPDDDGALPGAAKDDTTASTDDEVAWTIVGGSNIGLLLSPGAEDLTHWDICVRVQWTRKVP